MLERIVRKAVALGLASIAFLYSADTLTTRQGKKLKPHINLI
jgi:16S rRNA U1498 N3-methylase RsmE